jgi:hypothetical protein
VDQLVQQVVSKGSFRDFLGHLLLFFTWEGGGGRLFVTDFGSIKYSSWY